MTSVPVTVHQLRTVTEREVDQLADVLTDCVQGGASVGFMAPLSPQAAQAYWRPVADSVDRGERTLLVAMDADADAGAGEAGRIVGTVQVVPAGEQNQPHRGDLIKMLVHRRARRRGVGQALMQAAHQAARELGLAVLVLDTASDSAARLYEREGWQQVGVIPDYALLPNGGLCATTLYYRRLP